MRVIGFHAGVKLPRRVSYACFIGVAQRVHVQSERLFTVILEREMEPLPREIEFHAKEYGVSRHPFFTILLTMWRDVNFIRRKTYTRIFLIWENLIKLRGGSGDLFGGAGGSGRLLGVGFWGCPNTPKILQIKVI